MMKNNFKLITHASLGIGQGEQPEYNVFSIDILHDRIHP